MKYLMKFNESNLDNNYVVKVDKYDDEKFHFYVDNIKVGYIYILNSMQSL